MRPAFFAGQFYSADSQTLAKNIRNLFSESKIKPEKNAAGIISPHAGCEYSGKAAAESYSAIKNSKFDTFIILGTNHSGFENSVSLEDFETPFGKIENDEEFSEQLKKEFGGNETLHEYEHSIEVQLPFLQFVFGKPKIVPFLIGQNSYADCKKIAKEIMKIAFEQKKKICIIASSDFTHYGKGYDYMPFAGTDEQVKKKLYELDKKAISAILKMDSEKFYKLSENMTICGRMPITILIEYSKIMKAKAKLLDYYTSGDVVKDYSSAVGYASVVFTG
jgi:hypothetical protein